MTAEPIDIRTGLPFASRRQHLHHHPSIQGESIEGNCGRARGLLGGAFQGCLLAQQGGGPAPTGPKALYLDGTTSSWTHYDNVPNTMTYTQNFSLALWANLEEKAPSGNMRSHMMFSIIHNTVGPAMDFRDNKFMPGIQGVKWYEAGVSLNPYNNWNHYAFTITNTNTIYVYVNGVKVGTQSMQYTSISKVGVLSLGGQKFSGTLYDVPKGKIANVEIFSKTMTDSEVATLASGIDVVSNFATHVYTFETDGMAYDTGASRSKWNATLGSSARIVNAN